MITETVHANPFPMLARFRTADRIVRETPVYGFVANPNQTEPWPFVPFFEATTDGPAPWGYENVVHPKGYTLGWILDTSTTDLIGLRLDGISWEGAEFLAQEHFDQVRNA